MPADSNEIVRVLLHFKNAVVEGPPGTGKTHVVTSVAASWKKATGRTLKGGGDGQYAITFHPSTSYEDFIEGMRYDENKQKFIRRDGFLLRAVDAAQNDPDSDFLVLLDEINRANVPKVLGDALLCMEATKRTSHDGTEWTGGQSVTLPYSGRTFSMPENLYLLGTMNSSDRSIAPLDTALRRRFGFVRMEPLAGNALREAVDEAEGKQAAARAHRSIQELSNLNEVLRSCLGPDAELGHSYVFGMTPVSVPQIKPDYPLKSILEIAKRNNTTRAFWLEVSSGSGGSHNQFDVPDRPKNGSRQGLISQFYPMSSNGQLSATSPESGQTYFDIHWDGTTWSGNSIQYNPGGSNRRLKIMGHAPDGRQLSSLAADLIQKIHLWLARPDNTFDFVLLERNPANLALLRSLSQWSELSTPGPGGRSYGLLDLGKVQTHGQQPDPDQDEDAQWMTWRYAILPQLFETVTQLGATELFDPSTRAAWVDANGQPDAAERLDTFESFLSDVLKLRIVERGYGLARSLAIETVVPAAPDSSTTATTAVDELTLDEGDHDEGSGEQVDHSLEGPDPEASPSDAATDQ